ncbi:family 16 glycoside hydrolase [Rhodopirellula sp. SWK7]|uniref:family 16 glycoside hydrolase n=1 Tax=Rhodopirellula sp. SWK7 TaxID=595460 RepID=UPI0002BFB627|nr:family 16 glycoside hydrolase [Rhodopirellula sp. SWK7]EMI46899.1 sulfatase atsG [Rhodopirellula sp. SWK7]
MNYPTFCKSGFLPAIVLLSAVLGSTVIADDQASPEHNEHGQWIQLFNGKDLSGWTPKIRGHELGVNYADTFRVRDGSLVVTYEDYLPEDSTSLDSGKRNSFDKFGHLFYKDTFSHYKLRIEYRFVGEQIAGGPGWAYRNNGLMLHGQDPKLMTLNQKFPVSIEVQLLGGNGTDARTNLNLCTPGTNVVLNGKLFTPHCTSSNSDTYHGDRWVTAEIEVRGNEVVRHILDGKTVLEYTHPQYDPKDSEAAPLISDGNLMLDRGTISLQSESHPTEFRKIELLNLEKNAAPAKNDVGSADETDNVIDRAVGKWALRLPSGAAGWLSLTHDAGQIEGELWTVGAPKQLTDVAITDGKLQFFHRRAFGEPEYPGGPPRGEKVSCRHEATINGDLMTIHVEHPTESGGVDSVTFTGTRIEPVPAKPHLNRVTFGEPIELFNGTDLDGWRLTNPAQENRWKVVNSVLVNETPKTTFNPYAKYGNLRTDREFEDFNLNLDFKVPPGGNSGIYLRGRYEVQVVDRDSRMQGIIGIGSLFSRIKPTVNAGKPGGEWQHYDITLVDRHLTVILNGQKVIDNEPIVGCTNGALDADESKPGPIYLQGDHTSVQYRNIVLRPVVKNENHTSQPHGVTRSKTKRSRPNIVWLMAEDMGLDLECYAMAGVKTPNLNRLAKEGALFTNAYCSNPICSPNRSAMMVGVDQTRTNSHHHRSNRDVPLQPPFKPITVYLRDAGYTCLLGHSSVMAKGTKIDCNFRHDAIGPYDGVNHFGLFDKQADFATDDQPFFSQIQLKVTHRGDWWNDVREQSTHPVAVEDVELPPYFADTPEIRYDWATYLDTVEYMDNEVGVLMKSLRDQGIDQNTVVIFIADNGRCNLRGKGYLHESGIHVPMIVWAPGRVTPGTVIDDLVCTTDISASVLYLAGVPRPDYMTAEPLIDVDQPQYRQYVRSARDIWDEIDECSRSITTGRFKYIKNHMPDVPWDAHQAYLDLNRPAVHVMRRLAREGKLTANESVFFADRKPSEELYDLSRDPDEMHNLAADPEYAGVMAQMRALESEWTDANEDFGLKDLENRHPEFGLAGELARDGVRDQEPELWKRLESGELMATQGWMKRYQKKATKSKKPR